MSTVKTLDGEALVDVAVKHLGDATRVVELAQINGLSVTADLVAGSILEIPVVGDDKEKLVRILNSKE